MAEEKGVEEVREEEAPLAETRRETQSERSARLKAENKAARSRRAQFISEKLDELDKNKFFHCQKEKLFKSDLSETEIVEFITLAIGWVNWTSSKHEDEEISLDLESFFPPFWSSIPISSKSLTNKFNHS
jgi:hypothetical protein